MNTYRLVTSQVGLLSGEQTTSPKAEARRRLTAYIDARQQLAGRDDTISTLTAPDGIHNLFAADIREMLK